MPFPQSIKALIVTYSEWLVKYANHPDNMHMHASAELRNTIYAFQLLTPDQKNIEQRLKVIHVFIYSTISHELIRDPVYVEKYAKFLAGCKIECFRNVDAYNLSSTTQTEHQLVASQHYKFLPTLKKSNQIFYQEWLLRSNEIDLSHAIAEIENQEIRLEVEAWVKSLIESKNEILNNAAPAQTISPEEMIEILNGTRKDKAKILGVGFGLGVMLLLLMLSNALPKLSEGDRTAGTTLSIPIGIVVGFIIYFAVLLKPDHCCTAVWHTITPCLNARRHAHQSDIEMQLPINTGNQEQENAAPENAAPLEIQGLTFD